MSNDFDLDASFAALADPTRRAILARLALGEATVNELAEPFDMTQPAISQHLKVLESAGLIVGRIDGSRRPRCLSQEGIEAMDQWLAMLRKALERNYQRLDRRRYSHCDHAAFRRASRGCVPRAYRPEIDPEVDAGA